MTSKPQIPKRQHYIPQMLLRNFTDESGYLWAYKKSDRARKPYKARPKSLFTKQHLYTQYSDGGNQDNWVAELCLSQIESRANPVIRKVIEAARKDENPGLSQEERDACKRFFMTSLLRIPEYADQVLDKLNCEDVVYGVISTVTRAQGLGFPDRKSFDAHPQWIRVKEMLKHNIKAELAVGSPAELRSQMERLVKETGLLVGVIREPGTELLLGSCAVAIERDPAAGGWLPLAPDIAIMLTARPDKDFVYQLGQKEVWRINQASVERSPIIAGRYKALDQLFVQSNSR